MEPIIASIVELLIFSVPPFLFTTVLLRKHVLDKVGNRTLTILTCFGAFLMTTQDKNGG